jgi:palmitoyltransferase
MDTEQTDPGTSRESVVALARSVEQIQTDIRNLRISSPSRANRDPERVETVDGPMGLDAHFDENASTIGTTPKASVLPENGPAMETDYRVMYTADYGAQILQEGKKDLLRRLEPDSQRSVRSRRTRLRSPPPAMPAERVNRSPIPDPPDAPLALPSEDERDPLSEEEDSEDDYPVPGDDGRGLLTDVPLILGPSEIEVLPMIIMSGIVPPRSDQEGYGTTEQEVTAIKNMHTVRCHLLLAQDNGRNLLRELLIFVAAWDLRDDELYFKLMMKIIEAVLTNGLLPFSYHAFRESKDIISPAQAVIMKLLTSIFRSRQSDTARSRGLTVTPRTQRKPPGETAPYPERNDVHMVSFLFTEFRRHIIPQTCALIFLQGQIRNGTVSPDEFPLNLWDMERMYEGIYQYLEFFAILTEHDVWKGMMAEWEITSELVTLLEELDAAIPRSTPKHQPNYKQRAASRALVQYGPDPVQSSSAPAVERPYDVAPSSSADVPNGALPEEQGTAGSQQQSAYAPPPPEDEPSDFEWRNLKKLAVLVLSSLVWKSPLVQSQLSTSDSSGHKGRGVRALLNCCKIDEYNPYIREHAIMALRFALEGNKENQDVVRAMEKLGTEAGYGGEQGFKLDVPREVLDLNGYETFVDKRGQVQLKKKEVLGPGTVEEEAVGGASGSGSVRGKKERKEVVL